MVLNIGSLVFYISVFKSFFSTLTVVDFCSSHLRPSLVIKPPFTRVNCCVQTCLLRPRYFQIPPSLFGTRYSSHSKISLSIIQTIRHLQPLKADQRDGCKNDNAVLNVALTTPKHPTLQFYPRPGTSCWTGLQQDVDSINLSYEKWIVDITLRQQIWPRTTNVQQR